MTSNMDSGIYSITAPSGSQYIGSARSFRQRWERHLRDLRAGRHHNKPLQDAFKKYGEKAILFEKVLICAKGDLLFYEQRAIEAFRPAYNICKIAGSTLGVSFGPLSSEHRAKIAAAHKGEKSYWFGRKRSPETIEKMSKSQMGKTMSEEARAKMSLAARNMSAETRAKMSATRTGMRHTEETRAKLSLINKGKKAGAKHERARAVICVELGITFPTMTAAEQWLRENGHPKAARGSISLVCSGKMRSAYGYHWGYLSEPVVDIDNSMLVARHLIRMEVEA